MMKKSLAVLLLCLVMISFFGSGVRADDGESWMKQTSDWFNTNIFNNSDMGDAGFQKVLILFIAIGLVFSALGFIGFPENTAIRFAFSLVIGVLAISLITPSEIIAAMKSYKALGITITLALPIIIMMAISVQLAIKGNFMGIMVQRLLWLIYSLYLFITSIFQYGISQGWVTGGSSSGSLVDAMVKYFVSSQAKTTLDADPILVFIQIIISVVIFWWFFLENKKLMTWIKDQKFFTDMMNMRDTFKRSSARDKANAAATIPQQHS